MTTPAIPLSVLIEAHKALGAITSVNSSTSVDDKARAYAECVWSYSKLGAILKTLPVAVPVEIEQ